MSVTRKIKISIPVAGYNFSYSVGDEVEILEDLANAWVASGIAENLPEEQSPAEDPASVAEETPVVEADEPAPVEEPAEAVPATGKKNKKSVAKEEAK